MAVVETGDEVRDIVLFLAPQNIGDIEAEVVVFNIADDHVHIFERLGELLLPGVGVGDDVRDVAFIIPGSIDRPRCVEVNVSRRTERVVGPEDWLECWRIVGRCDNCPVDAVGRIVGKLDQ